MTANRKGAKGRGMEARPGGEGSGAAGYAEPPEPPEPPEPRLRSQSAAFWLTSPTCEPRLVTFSPSSRNRERKRSA